MSKSGRYAYGRNGHVGKSKTHLNILTGTVCVFTAAIVVVQRFPPAEGGEGS